MKAVVTGGAGFIGSHLVDALIERGDEVIYVDNLVGGTKHLNAHPRSRFVYADVAEWARHSANLAGVDTVFHLAAGKWTVCLTDPETDLRTNALGTLRLVKASVEAGVRKFVHASTGSVLDGEPVSFYGITKLAGEGYVRVAGEGLDWTILRYYNVIGPRQDDSDTGGVVPIFVRHAKAGEPLTIYGTGMQTRSFTSVHDVVRANLLVAEEPGASRRILACGSGISVSIGELAEYVRSEVRGVPVLYEPRKRGDVDAFPVDNGELTALGMTFDTDWRGVVRSVIGEAVAA